MAIEIERKFLVVSDQWRALVEQANTLRQTYLATTDKASVRVRIVDDSEARLTIKSSDIGAVRAEFEYNIPLQEAVALMSLGLGTPIEKVRYSLTVGDLVWEIDVFEGANAGLVIAEVELKDQDQPIAPPNWLGTEVTDDRRYYNSNLTYAPFSTWSSGD